MAPKPEGFNLGGLLLPGAAIAGGGRAALFALISRRRRGRQPRRHRAERPARRRPRAATPEELERLRRALAEVED